MSLVSGLQDGIRHQQYRPPPCKFVSSFHSLWNTFLQSAKVFCLKTPSPIYGVRNPHACPLTHPIINHR
ncbi:uncharacterized protein YALI1_F21673g [Yarrowia lipolytica]|uniref:Uncharacterized protein n=1 Tax=Yarrowia lipolytica TaxID=4952 RepID=A0A1D8NNP4_YARLL|nr:hypothetical protein YALI1_F21673g [Yarrowia lipolytica]